MMAPTDDLTYSYTTPEDRDEALLFYGREFVPREPMALGLGLTWDCEREWVTAVMDAWCACEASVIVRDPTKNNKIVGIRLCKFGGRDSGNTFLELVEKSKGKVRVFLKALCKVLEGVDFFKDETVDKVLEYGSLGVAEGYSGRGMAYRMCEMSEKRGKELGAQYVQVCATNIKSQRIFRKMGFEVRGSIDYATYEEDGEKVFDISLMGESTCLLGMTKKL